MVDLTEAEGFISKVRTLRVAGDADAIADLFDDHATFRIVGFGEPAVGKAAIRQALGSLIDQFEFLEYRPIKIFVEGDEVSVRHGVQIRHRPSGTVVHTETSDFLTLKNGKCSSFTQYADTAMAIGLTKI